MNYLRTAILLAGLTGLFMAVGYLIGGGAGALIALVIAAATNLFSYWNADNLVLSMHGADIESGRLVRLNLPDWRGGKYPMQAIHMTDTPPGPAGGRLIGRLATLSDGAKAPTQETARPINGKGRRQSPRSVSAHKSRR
jgi:hypothetical protein